MTSLIVVMGVSGCGKTTVGEALSRALGIEFIDGDDLHPPENVQRMRAGLKLDDESRLPWLEAICRCAESHFANDQSVIIACSALKAKYRDQLRSISRPVLFVYLNGPQPLIAERMSRRAGHYMPVTLLDSQFAELEDPRTEPNILEVNIDQSAEQMASQALQQVQARLDRGTSDRF